MLTDFRVWHLATYNDELRSDVEQIFSIKINVGSIRFIRSNLNMRGKTFIFTLHIHDRIFPFSFNLENFYSLHRQFSLVDDDDSRGREERERMKMISHSTKMRHWNSSVH